MTLIFIRFINQISEKRKLSIGFKITSQIGDVFKIMLMSIIDFTIPDSCCNLFYKDLNGKFRTKTYKKTLKNNAEEDIFYVNGNVW